MAGSRMGKYSNTICNRKILYYVTIFSEVMNMDKIDVAALGVGAFAAVQLINNFINQDNSHMRSLMRAESMEIQDLANQSGNNPVSDTTDEAIVPGIALNEFESNKYKIKFKYPRSWTKNPRYEDKYEGTSGFFEIGDFTGIGENIDQAVQAEINEENKPYGSNPTVRRFIVDGQPARVIYPSEDQSSFYNDRDVAIVVQYPQAIEIEGRIYDYVVIWASREYVPLILSTLRFIKA